MGRLLKPRGLKGELRLTIFNKVDETPVEEVETVSDAEDSKEEISAEKDTSEEKPVETDSEEVKTDEESVSEASNGKDESVNDTADDNSKKKNS